MTEKIVVAMSGGVDSGLTAALLCERGFRVEGVTLRLHDPAPGEPEPACGSADGPAVAAAVCARLGIPHRILDGVARFDDAVLRPSWNEYARGRTPNPCVLCNAGLKFGLLLDHALAVGADRIATGHYARLVPDADGALRLRRGRDPRKDQSYFLFALSAAQRAAALMPLGEFTKDEVRALAAQRDLPCADRAESQDACFAGDDDFPELLRRHFDAPARPGDVADDLGRVVGAHRGLHRYTIGQRQGLQISLGRPAWVAAIDADTARLVLTTDPDRLLADRFVASGVLWHGAPHDGPALVQIRYRHPAAPARLTPLPDGRALVTFDRPQRAVTPGQATVFYADDLVLGGGWIERAYRPDESLSDGAAP